MTAARRLRQRLATLALIEQREHNPGTRSRWTVALVELDERGARTLEAWHGVGPLGRLRAHRDAREHCERARIEPHTVQLEDQRKPCNVLAWEQTRLLARLRDEGVLPHAKREEPVR